MAGTVLGMEGTGMEESDTVLALMGVWSGGGDGQAHTGAWGFPADLRLWAKR